MSASGGRWERGWDGQSWGILTLSDGDAYWPGSGSLRSLEALRDWRHQVPQEVRVLCSCAEGGKPETWIGGVGSPTPHGVQGRASRLPFCPRYDEEEDTRRTADLPAGVWRSQSLLGFPCCPFTVTVILRTKGTDQGLADPRWVTDLLLMVTAHAALLSGALVWSFRMPLSHSHTACFAAPSNSRFFLIGRQWNTWFAREKILKLFFPSTEGIKTVFLLAFSSFKYVGRGCLTRHGSICQLRQHRCKVQNILDQIKARPDLFGSKQY